jgi:hypothetical protein
MYLITLLKSGVRLLVEILITACKLMSVNENLYLLLLIFKQEKRFGCAREGNLGLWPIFLTVLAGHKKTLSGPLFAYPCLKRLCWPYGYRGKAIKENGDGYVVNGATQEQFSFFCGEVLRITDNFE